MRLALVVEYDGTEYKGFQYQANAPSIQEEIEKALEKLTGEPVRVSGAGRTDAGVHALGQVVSFRTSSRHPVETFVKALNFHLPDDIAIKSGWLTDNGFDPRRHALSRRYRYTIGKSASRSPLMRRTAHVMNVEDDLDLEAMTAALRLLEGRHDFARFAGPVDGDGSTERVILEASLHDGCDRVTFDFEGNAFLPHQVRRMVGSVVDVGKGKITLGQLGKMIEGEDIAVSHSLPPEGLCLVSVKYEESQDKGEE